MRLARALLVLGLLAACESELRPRLDERLALGKAHSCVVVPDGRVACWGEGNGGELGADEDSAGPRAIAGIQRASRIRAAEAGGCAIDGDALRCWGAPLEGEETSGPAVRVIRAPAPAHFAVGSEVCWDEGSAVHCLESAMAPVREQGALGFTQGRLCRVGTSGVECRFLDEFAAVRGTEGAVVFTEHAFVNAARELRPFEHSRFEVEDIDEVVVLGPTAFSHHVCAIREDGLVHCAGTNEYGQLGRGSTSRFEGHWEPVDGVEGAVAVATGASHSCALTGEGVWCWGRNHQGQLGDGSTVNSAVPVRVTGLNFVAEPLLTEAGPGPRCLIQDRDGDGISDPLDGEYDLDGDGLVSADDEDSDGDGLLDRDEWPWDACGERRRPGCSTVASVDFDLDGVPDAEEENEEARCTPDHDDDGCIDLAEAMDRCGPFDISFTLPSNGPFPPGPSWVATVPGPAVPGELSLTLSGLELPYRAELTPVSDGVLVKLYMLHWEQPIEGPFPETRQGEVFYLNDDEPWAQGNLTVVIVPPIDI